MIDSLQLADDIETVEDVPEETRDDVRELIEHFNWDYTVDQLLESLITVRQELDQQLPENAPKNLEIDLQTEMADEGLIAEGTYTGGVKPDINIDVEPAFGIEGNVDHIIGKQFRDSLQQYDLPLEMIEMSNNVISRDYNGHPVVMRNSVTEIEKERVTITAKQQWEHQPTLGLNTELKVHLNIESGEIDLDSAEINIEEGEIDIFIPRN